MYEFIDQPLPGMEETLPTEHKWVCAQDECDGEHHYYQWLPVA